MVVNIQSERYQEIENGVTSEGHLVSEEMKIRSYSSLINDIKKKKIPIASRNKYMYIEFPDSEASNFNLDILYEIQLLGYVPIIANAERNSKFRRNPYKLYRLILKGALIQIDVSSLQGESGRLIRKFAIKLCKHKFVHFVSSSSQGLVSISSFPITVDNYFNKRHLKYYLNYLKNNAKHLRKGTDFHIETPIKF